MVSDQIAEGYAATRDIDRDQIKNWMAEETWFTGDQAKAAGFIDEVTTPIQMAAQYDLSNYKHPPESLQRTKPVTKSGQSSSKCGASAAIQRMTAAVKARNL